MFEKMKMKSPDIVSENMAYIARRWPECITEAKDENGRLRTVIDFDKLRQLLSSDATGERQERYQFTWPDKRHAIRLANTPTTHTLRPLREDSVDFDNTRNLYIEGDNLDVLKLLRESYLGKVKMIYIDPPYNTGGDFVYKDNFIKRSSDYAEVSGAYDEEGNQVVQEPEKNVDSNGRFHTDWLNMIYPRLKVARDLLTEDGVIFISIDDNEVENLKKVCAEIFGGNNFEGHIHWRRRHNQPNDITKMIGLVAEHIIVYAKNSKYLKTVGVGKLDLTASFTNPDSDPNGPWASKPWKVGSDQSGSKYSITTPTGKVINGEWMGEESTYNKFLEEGRIYFPKGGDGMPRKKYYQFEREEEGQCATNWWPHDQFGHNQGANDYATALFGRKNVFSNPKPIELLRGLMKIGNVKNNDIVLDFFSGSGTTADVTMRLNAEDRKNRHYICVQLSEKTTEDSEAYKAGYKTICEIGKERIRRAGKKIKEEHPDWKGDTGFRVLKLESSNMENVFYTPAETTELTLFADNIKPDRTDEDLLFQVMMELGIALSDKIEKTVIAGKTVWNVGQGYLMACFERDVTEDTIKTIAKQQPQYFVMADRSLASDNVADNFEQLFEEYSPDTQRRIL